MAEIEARLVQATRAWTDDLRAALIEEHGEEQGASMFRRYERAFPPGYRSDWVARSAVVDIGRLEELRPDGEPILSLYRPLEAQQGVVRCKLFSSGGVSLSDVLPTFEHMGAKVVDERPYEIAPDGADPAWVYDFGLRIATEDIDEIREDFQEAFLGRVARRARGRPAERAGGGGGADRAGRSRSSARSPSTCARPGSRSRTRTWSGPCWRIPKIATLLVGLFVARFDPTVTTTATAQQTKAEIEAAIDAVKSLDEDRILRSFLSVVCADPAHELLPRRPVAGWRTDATSELTGARTNGDRAPAAAAPYVSIKLDPTELSMLPLPRPQFEIFVYSPRVEGVHLRGGKVARGGMRWSDRREDFRTEVLGLMKAQMVKNALIVPVGSKGGFVVKRPPAGAGGRP